MHLHCPPTIKTPSLNSPLCTFPATDFSLSTSSYQTKPAEMPSQSTFSNHFHAIDGDDMSHEDLACDEQPLDLDSPETFFDLPLESFWLPESHGHDWFDRNVVMHRKRSMKFSFAGNLNHHLKSFSARFWPSVNQKTNTPLIRPLKTQNSCLVDGNFRRDKVGTARLFRCRSEPGGKLVKKVSEPGSPRVYCMGRVATEAVTETKRAKKIGFWRSFKSIFRSRYGEKMVVDKSRTGIA